MNPMNPNVAEEILKILKQVVETDFEIHNRMVEIMLEMSERIITLEAYVDLMQYKDSQ